MEFKLKQFALILDIETLSTHSNAVISELALTMVNLSTGEIEFCIEQNFNTAEQIDQGFNYDQGTEQWAKDNLPVAVYLDRVAKCDAIQDNKQTLKALIERVGLALEKYRDGFNVYCKGGNFDYPILTNFCNHYLNIPNAFPWSFRQELCIRLFESMFYNKQELKVMHQEIKDHVSSVLGREAIPHTAVDDTLMEAEFFHRVYLRLVNALG